MNTYKTCILNSLCLLRRRCYYTFTGRLVLFVIGLVFLLIYMYINGQALTHTHSQRLTSPLHHPDIKAVNQLFSQSISETISRSLVVQAYVAGYKLYNSGTRNITKGNWTIYLDLLYTHTTTLKPCNMTIEHIDGTLHRLLPTDDFHGIAPAQAIRCSLSLSPERYHQFPNWYVAEPGKQALLIWSTAGESLHYVKFAEEIKPLPMGNTKTQPRITIPPPSKSMIEGVKMHVIPTPKHVAMEKQSEIVFNPESWSIRKSKGFENEQRILAGTLGIPIQPEVDERYITIRKSAGDTSDPESYVLNISVNPDVITIYALTSRGAFYGVQTLLSLIEGRNGILVKSTIKDNPRFSYRGLMVDVSRNFFSKSTLLKLIDVISTYKMNHLHIHLGDDEGWRLEIPGIPELTEYSGRRCHSHNEYTCLIPSLGSGPDTSTSGSGFYTIADYREILTFAKSRHVTIVPEVDAPGHMRASVRAMIIREDKRATSDRFLQSYLLSDSISHSKSIQNWRNNAINPCIPTTYRFIEKVLSAIVNMHKDIQPLEWMHLGGDEVSPSSWSNSISCERLMNNTGTSVVDVSKLKHLFIARVSAILRNFNLSVALWEDDLLTKRGGAITPSKALGLRNAPTTFIWKNPTKARRMSENGYRVILCEASHFYFDQRYEPSPEERGLKWATSYTDTHKVFMYSPNTIGPYLTGMQANIWSELIRSEEQLHYMLFPRLIAFAERAWHEAPWETAPSSQNARAGNHATNSTKDWEFFMTTVAVKELPRLAKHRIHYRIPPPSVYVNNNKLTINHLYPGFAMEIRRDNDTRWETVSDVLNLNQLSGVTVLWFRARCNETSRTSRALAYKLRK